MVVCQFLIKCSGKPSKTLTFQQNGEKKGERESVPESEHTPCTGLRNGLQNKRSFPGTWKGSLKAPQGRTPGRDLLGTTCSATF